MSQSSTRCSPLVVGILAQTHPPLDRFLPTLSSSLHHGFTGWRRGGQQQATEATISVVPVSIHVG